MVKLECFYYGISIDMSEILIDMKQLLLRVPSWVSLDSMFRKFSYLQQFRIENIFGTFLWTLMAILLISILYWKYSKIKDLNPNKYVDEVHLVAGSLDPSTESVKNCIKILNLVPSFINHPKGPHNYTPFLRACWSGNTTLVRFMLMHGADITCCTSSGENPIFLAAYRTTKSTTWNPSILEMLFKSGCPLSKPTTKGITALHYAASVGHVTLTRWLLMHGAHLKMQPCKITPYDIAIRKRETKYQSVAALLHLYCPQMAEKGLKNLSQKEAAVPNLTTFKNILIHQARGNGNSIANIFK